MAPLAVRASLLALFFAPCRAATLYEVYRRLPSATRTGTDAGGGGQ